MYEHLDSHPAATQIRSWQSPCLRAWLSYGYSLTKLFTVLRVLSLCQYTSTRGNWFIAQNRSDCAMTGSDMSPFRLLVLDIFSCLFHSPHRFFVFFCFFLFLLSCIVTSFCHISTFFQFDFRVKAQVGELGTLPNAAGLWSRLYKQESVLIIRWSGVQLWGFHWYDFTD